MKFEAKQDCGNECADDTLGKLLKLRGTNRSLFTETLLSTFSTTAAEWKYIHDEETDAGSQTPPRVGKSRNEPYFPLQNVPLLYNAHWVRVGEHPLSVVVLTEAETQLLSSLLFARLPASHSQPASISSHITYL